MQKIVNAMWSPVMNSSEIVWDFLVPALLIVGGIVVMALGAVS